MPNFDLLSNRELEILKLAAQGKLDKEIVGELGVSINTLRTYWNRIRAKLGDRSRANFAAAWVSAEYHRGLEPGTVSKQDFHLSWQFDGVTQTVTVSDCVNDALGLQRGQAHPAYLYKPLLHQEDLQAVIAAISAAAADSSPHFSVTHRTLRKGRVTCDHTFGTVYTSGSGQITRIDGDTVVLHECSKVSEIQLGLWSLDLETNHLKLDSDCLQMLGIKQDDGYVTSILQAFRSLILAEDLQILENLFSQDLEGNLTKTRAASLRIRTADNLLKQVEIRARRDTSTAILSGTMSVLPTEYILQALVAS